MNYDHNIEGMSFDPQSLFEEIKRRAKEQGVSTRDEWDDLVPQVMDEKRDFAEIHDDDDWTGIVEELKARFEEYADELEADADL